MKITKNKLIELVIGIISVFVCIFANTTNGYEYMFIVPLVYVICRFVINLNTEKLKNNIGIVAIEFLTFLKYAIMPILIVIMKDYYGGVLTQEIPDSRYIQISFVFLVIECITVFLAILLYSKLYKKDNKEKNIEIKIKIKINVPILIIFGITSIFIMKYYNSFLPSQFLFIDKNYATNSIDSAFDGMIIIFFYLFKVFTMLYLIQYFYFRYKKNNKTLNIALIFLTLLVYIISVTSTSRWSLLLPFIVVIFILKKILFEKVSNKIMIYIVSSILAISIISISIYKFNWLFQNKTIDEVSASDIVTILGSQIQEYISGPRPIAQGIETLEKYHNDISYKTLFNDFVGSIPFVSHYINQEDRINVYYNYFLKGTDRIATQIMPMITIGYAYFNYFMCNIFILVFIICALKCGEYAKTKEDIFRKYIYSYLSIWLALCLGFNTQIIFGWFISNFVPFIIIIYFNDKINYRKEKNK